MPRRHLLSVWNPAYGANAMEAHLRVLQDRVRNYRAGRCGEDEVYVWWGKVRSESRYQPLPHREEILALPTEADRNDEDVETHIYLTDFSSLYVAHLGEVTTDDPRTDRKETGRYPSYYRKQKLECDFWFKLWDIRRLVADDMPMVVHELRKLRNVRHHDRPVSIYGGMVDLPLIVTADDEHRYFDREFLERYTEGAFWVETDAERAGVGQMERELRENLFGDAVWQTFGPTARRFIATAEKLFRDHARDPNFDFGPVIVEYCKAVEIRCNDVLRRGLRDAPPAIRSLNRSGTSVELKDGVHWGLRDIGKLLGDDKERREQIVRRFENARWLVDQLPAILDDLAGFRGPAAHSEPVDHPDAVRWRNRLCGIGCKGDLVELSEVKPKPAVTRR